jgi:hypothetical protein
VLGRDASHKTRADLRQKLIDQSFRVLSRRIWGKRLLVVADHAEDLLGVAFFGSGGWPRITRRPGRAELGPGMPGTVTGMKRPKPIGDTKKNRRGFAIDRRCISVWTDGGALLYYLGDSGPSPCGMP